MDIVRRKAKDVARELGAATTESVKNYLEKNRFKVYIFDQNDCCEFLELYPAAKNYIRWREAFSLRMGWDVIICVNKDHLADLRHLLLHELGHILLGHDIESLMDQDETDAERFTMLVFKYCQAKSLTPIRHWPAAAAIAGACVVLSIAWVLYGTISATPATGASRSAGIQVENRQPGDLTAAEVLITASGDKYHLPDCQYVKDRASVTTVSLTEALRLGKEPCKVCRPPEVAE